jgi:uncharacterized membrane protein YjjP (DUF1212 family)
MPREYYRRLVDLAMEAGQIMMSAGAETHRVEDTIMRILSTSEFSHTDAFVLRTGITIPLSDPRYKTISITRRVYSGPPHLSKVSDVNKVSRDFCAGLITIDQAERQINEAAKRTLYSPVTIFLSHMFASSGFAYVFGGGFLEAFLALFVGFVLGYYNVYIAKHIRKDFLADLLAAAIVVVASVGFTYFLSEMGIAAECQYIIAGSLMPLVPGTAFGFTDNREICADGLLERLTEQFRRQFQLAGGSGVLGTVGVDDLIPGVGVDDQIFGFFRTLGLTAAEKDAAKDCT